MGYSHIELMPMSEYLYDLSWGYQTIGYFSPTSRYGDPTMFMKFIDSCHQNHVGVILDLAYFHFTCHQQGLALFDGEPLYEYSNLNQRYTSFGTSYFNLEKKEVRSFILSSICYWLKYYHIDGLCFNDMNNLIYYQGNKLNKNALEFIKYCNETCHLNLPGVMLISKDLANISNVTDLTIQNDLGFDYIWHLKWVKETLNYLSKDPIYRFYHHQQMTSFMHFYNEKYILPLSHDEFVHSQKTLINKLWGNQYQKLSQLKSLYLYMYTVMGKKLSFMGNELVQTKEWDEMSSLEWKHLDNPIYHSFFRFIQKLNQIYHQEKALFYSDYQDEGFCWLIEDDAYQNVFAYQRCYKKEVLVIVINFGSSKHYGYLVPVQVEGNYEELLNTDQDIYMGSHFINEKCKSKMKRIQVNIAPFASMIFKLK